MSHTVVDRKFHELFDKHAQVRQLGSGFIFTEGSLWHPVDNYLIFSDMPGDVRRRWTPQDGISEIMRPSNKGNGMTYDADLNLLVCEHSTSLVARFRRDGIREVLCSHFEGKELNSPNDICVRSDGSIYFTDPTYGRKPHFGVERPLQQRGSRASTGCRPGTGRATSRNWCRTAIPSPSRTACVFHRVNAGCRSTTPNRPISACLTSPRTGA